jgi:hypothetical protein
MLPAALAVGRRPAARLTPNRRLKKPEGLSISFRHRTHHDFSLARRAMSA